MDGRDPDFAKRREKMRMLLSKSGNSPHADEDRRMYRKIVAVWQDAVKNGDPAAETSLGWLFWGEANRKMAILNFVSKSDPDTDPMYHPQYLAHDKDSLLLLSAFKWACGRALELFRASDQQDWPDASMAQAVIYAYPPPLPPLLAETGCMFANPLIRDRMTQRSANLGSADGIFALVQVFRKQHDDINGDRWQSKLEQRGRDGDRKALQILAHEDALLNARSK